MCCYSIRLYQHPRCHAAQSASIVKAARTQTERKYIQVSHSKHWSIILEANVDQFIMVTHSAAIGMSSPLHNQWTNGLPPPPSVSDSLKRANLCHQERTPECVLCSASPASTQHGNAANLMPCYIWALEKHRKLTNQQLTWSAARTPGAPGPLAGAGYEPFPPRSPLDPWCSLP